MNSASLQSSACRCSYICCAASGSTPAPRPLRRMPGAGAARASGVSGARWCSASPSAAGRASIIAAAVADQRRDFDGNTGGRGGFSTSADALAELGAEERATVLLFERARASVVNIATASAALRLFPLSVESLPRGIGSGWIYDTKGHVVTNAHVIQSATEVKVTLANQLTYSARLVGADREKDLAVLRLDMPAAKAAELQPVALGSSAGLLVGQRVVAIGNPFGLDYSLTQGVVSGLGRELPRGGGGGGGGLTNVIQTDAAINPGNSGGPLLDSKGRLVGINTAILDPSGLGISSGIGFAIAIDGAKGLIEQLLAHGRVLRPTLGVTLAPPAVLQARRMEGVLILGVSPSGPAAAAGLQPTRRELFGLSLGDIIVEMDGRPIRAQKDLFAALDERRVGDVVALTVLSGAASRKTVKIKLADRSQMAAFE